MINILKKEKELSKRDYLKLYDKFLKLIDKDSAINIRKCDQAINIIKDKLSDEGFEVDEFSCKKGSIVIKRNQNGFFVDESNSLKNVENYHLYYAALQFFDKNEEVFISLNKYLSEKDRIMGGEYTCKKIPLIDVKSIAEMLGYGKERYQKIYEENPIHPSKEYLYVIDKLNAIDLLEDEVQINELIDELMLYLKQFIKDEYELSISYGEEKFDAGFDDAFGIIGKNRNIDDVKMLFGTDGENIYKVTFDAILKKDCNYIDQYFKIILKGMTKIMAINNNKNKEIA